MAFAVPIFSEGIGQDRNPRLSCLCIVHKVNQIIIRYAFYNLLQLGFGVDSNRNVLLNKDFYQEVLFIKNECVYGLLVQNTKGINKLPKQFDFYSDISILR